MPVTVYSEHKPFTWLDAFQPTPDELSALAEQYGLNPYALSDSMQPDHLPKHEVHGEIHFIILRAFTREPGSKSDTVQEMTDMIALFYTTQFLITVHKHDYTFLPAIAADLGSVKHRNPGQIVVSVLSAVLGTYEKPTIELSMFVDRLERRVFLRSVTPVVLEDLYFVRREASVCRKLLLLSEEPINAVRTEDLPALQDLKDLHTKLLHLYGQVNEDVNNLLNTYLSLSSHKSSEEMKVLTIFSVFFLPITFIAGVYGMNFQYMPELAKSWGYPASLILMAVTSVVIFAWFKRKHWL